jgi:hypothetical protein
MAPAAFLRTHRHTFRANEAEIRNAQKAEGRLQTALWIVAHPDLCCQKNFASSNAERRDALADFALVAIDVRGIDMTESGMKGGGNQNMTSSSSFQMIGYPKAACAVLVGAGNEMVFRSQTTAYLTGELRRSGPANRFRVESRRHRGCSSQAWSFRHHCLTTR